ncbi:MAG: hypothetical protein ACRDJ3_06175 [Solirubrobacteraceae bacterium]
MRENASADDHDVLRVVKSGIHDRLVDPANPRPFAVRELVLKIGDPLDVEEALADMHGVGPGASLRRVRMGHTRGARGGRYRAVATHDAAARRSN